MQTLLEGKFITIEGIEGVGKSTAVNYIADFLTNAHLSFILTREPGGTLIAEKIRDILLTPCQEESILPETELLLMFACRRQHIEKVILPALSSGQWVVSDRFCDATYAYQGGGRNIPFKEIEMLDRWIVNTLSPDLTILLDTTPEIGLARAKHRGPQDRIEQEKVDFFRRVRETYLKRAKENSARFRVVDAAQSLEEVQKELKNILEGLIQ